jgi:hypothetical protein
MQAHGSGEIVAWTCSCCTLCGSDLVHHDRTPLLPGSRLPLPLLLLPLCCLLLGFLFCARLSSSPGTTAYESR